MNASCCMVLKQVPPKQRHRGHIKASYGHIPAAESSFRRGTEEAQAP